MFISIGTNIHNYQVHQRPKRNTRLVNNLRLKTLSLELFLNVIASPSPSPATVAIRLIPTKGYSAA